MKGILLAIQFFTSIPIRKEYPMDAKRVTMMYGALPFVGLLIGGGMMATLWVSGLLGFGSLLTAVLMLIVGIALTGGLHLDGVADTSDAYFSYRDQAKRHEILADPRLGAFGTLGLVLIILLKLALLTEWISSDSVDWVPILLIPFLARGMMVLYFVSMKSAKQTGMAYFFLERLKRPILIVWTILCLVVALVGFGLWMKSLLLPLVLTGVFVVILYIYRRWTLQNFGGVTGDLSGAFIEGMEVVLWLVILSLL